MENGYKISKFLKIYVHFGWDPVSKQVEIPRSIDKAMDTSELTMQHTFILAQVNIIKPSKIYKKLKFICKHLVHWRQEDAHEFLRYLIESFQKCYLISRKVY